MLNKIFLCAQVIGLLMVAVQGAQEIVCEATYDLSWPYFAEPMATCFLSETTVIEANDVVIKSDYAAIGIYCQGNKNITQLPIEINKVFPNLFILDATYCSVKNIGPKNFVGLTDLATIWMGGNYIVDIPKDTFKDLVSLRSVDLRTNYITVVSVDAFSTKSVNIHELSFTGNICMDRDYTSLSKVIKEIATFCIRTPKKMNNFDLLKTSTTTQADIGIPKVSCRRTRRVFWAYVYGRLDTCLVNRSITIDANNTRLDSEYSARGFYMQDNKNIFYLPVDIFKVFPNLIILDATYCSVKSVGPENIRNLKYLEFLWLRSNHIEFIPKGTMRGLVALSCIDLRYNRIKSIAADAFGGSYPDMNSVNFSGNECIDEDFENITMALKAITKVCKPENMKTQ